MTPDKRSKSRPLRHGLFFLPDLGHEVPSSLLRRFLSVSVGELE